MFSIKQLKMIFRKEIALEFLKQERKELFGKKTKRSTKDTYLGNDMWLDLQQIDIKRIKDYVRNYSISGNGKYYNIHNNLDYFKNVIAKTNILREESPCHPHQFSESCIKPIMRKLIEELDDNIIENCLNESIPKLVNHIKERINQQMKADYTEYIIMNHCENIIPTLKHRSGIDMFLLEDSSSFTTITELDIKTTRSVHNEHNDPKKAIIKLYEKQSEDRFSANTRLYIYLSDNLNLKKEKIIQQLYTTYDIEFNYKDKRYTVEKARIIYL